MEGEARGRERSRGEREAKTERRGAANARVLTFHESNRGRGEGLLVLGFFSLFRVTEMRGKGGNKSRMA